MTIVLIVAVLLVREARRQRRLSVRAAGEQLGVQFTNLSRIEHGQNCTLSTAVKILCWLDDGKHDGPISPWEPDTEEPA